MRTDSLLMVATGQSWATLGGSLLNLGSGLVGHGY